MRHRMISLWAVCLCGALATLVFSGKALAQKVPYLAVVLKDNTPLRAAAGPTYYPVGSLKAGTVVQVDDMLFNWSRVAVPEGTSSYIRQQHVDRRGDGTQGVVNSNYVEVFAIGIGDSNTSPDDAYIAHGLVPKGGRVKILDSVGSHYLIAAPDSAYAFLEPGSVRPATATEITVWENQAGRTAEGQAPEGVDPEAEDPEADDPEAQDSEAQDPEAQDPEAQDSEAQDSEAQDREAEAADAQNQSQTVADAERAEQLDALAVALDQTQAQSPTQTQAGAVTEPADGPTGGAVNAQVSGAQVSGAQVSEALGQTGADPTKTQTETQTPTQTATQTPTQSGPAALIDAGKDAPASVVVASGGSPALVQVEAQMLPMFLLPAESQPLDRMAAAYEALAKDPSLTDDDRELVKARLGVIASNRQLADTIRQLRAAQEAMEAARAQEAAQPSIAPNRFDQIGLLMTSSLYDGVSLPKLYRLVDPTSQRTIAYVEPVAGTATRQRLDTMVGKVIGLTGQDAYDPSLRRRVFSPKSVQLIRPGQAG